MPLQWDLAAGVQCVLCVAQLLPVLLVPDQPCCSKCHADIQRRRDWTDWGETEDQNVWQADCMFMEISGGFLKRKTCFFT